MKDRVKILRKFLSKTQDSFASEIGLTGNFVYMVEKGMKLFSDRTIKDICRIYNVNENWLRTGEGEMFVPLTHNQEIAAFCNKVMSEPDGEFKKRLIRALSNLDDAGWEAIEKLLDEITKG
jgi:transcriptional regulator with XRE-family HTH domain